MDGIARGAANRQSQAQNKLRLVLCLFSLFMISLAGGASLGAQADQLAKNGDARAQNNGAPSGSSRSQGPKADRLAIDRPAPTEAPAPTGPQDPKADWWAIDRAVADQLSVNDLSEVVKSLPREAPIGATGELMRQLNIFLRAGHRHRAAKVIERLPKDDDESYEKDLAIIADFLIERLELDMARRLLERFPHIMPHRGSGLIDRWAKNGDPTEIDRWLAARMDDTYNYRPPSSRPSRRHLRAASWVEGSYDHWLFIRLGFRTGQGTEGELLDFLADEVRSRPADLTRSMRYMKAAEVTDAVRSRQGMARGANKLDISWMGDICKPTLAFECYLLGTQLAGRSPRAAISLFERALSLPFTDQDMKLMDEMIVSHWAFRDPSMKWEKMWRDWTRLELARSYKADDQAGRAQPIIEELTAAYPDGLPDIDLIKFAGQVQAASGARVVENRVVKAEFKNANSVEYWLKRAQYYIGRNEKAEAIEAFERALALSPSAINRTENYGQRLEILFSYARFLGGPVKSPEAKQMLWDEFKKLPLDTPYAKRMVSGMTYVDYYTAEDYYAAFFGADASRLWDFLAAQREWGETEIDLLGRMARRLTPAEGEALWDRAETLARGASPTRVYALSRALMRREAYLRAIPVLKESISRPTTDLEKSLATSDLYRAYIKTNNWKAAEAMWPSFTRMGTSPGAFGEIAVAAANAQAPDEAMRFWRAKANFDRGDFSYLSDLAKLGLKERLRSFYLQLSKDDPESWAPMAALQLLQ